jgi:citrate lyase subunit beta/citryl-CoA lyase
VQHPRDVLLGAQATTGFLPVCDHYSGVPARMRKSLALQAELTQEFGACVFDVTLDCEDGAPVGAEQEHADCVVELVRSVAGLDLSRDDAKRPRVAVRLHPVDHPAFGSDMATVARGAGALLSHLMIPKVESVADVDRAVQVLAQASSDHLVQALPLHVLVESPAAVHRAFDIAAHPRVQSISFGLMDFVSSHGGAIPAAGMSGEGQFSHPLVVRAKLEIASACHAHGKAPSHCVVTEFRDAAAIEAAARMACTQMGFTRMWSIHPDQIRPILTAFAPLASDIAVAAEIIDRAQAAQWAPIAYQGQLHDRASYRLFWHVLERAFRTGQALPDMARRHFGLALQ